MSAKKNLYLVQVDILRKTPMFCTAYLPYAVGTLWAYARQAPSIDQTYALREFFFLRDPIEDVAARIEAPFLVGFSCYSWNTEYNKALAQAVKKRYPNCYILFGGHNVPPGGAMLEDLPYVDFLIHGEGEIPFRGLLAELCEAAPAFSKVPGLSYRAGQVARNNPEGRPESVAAFPSPYLAGLFDPIMAAHPDIQWSIVWETNRGCANHCAYCDWGRGTKLRNFSRERVMAEIEWICANKIDYVACVDSNFGLLPQDEEILDAVVAAHERTGYPDVFSIATAKDHNERLYRIAKKLSQSGMDKQGPTLSVQSLSPEVLRNIGRKNQDDATISNWIQRYRQAGCRTRTDIILGLPGETLQSFCAGVEKMYTLGQHYGVSYFPCYILPNAPMGEPAYLEKHKIRTTRKIVKQIMEDTAEDGQVDEFIDMVVETATMPHADWLTANFFMFLAQGLHGYGFLRFLAMYMHTEHILPYADFYTRLLAFCHENPESLLGEAMARVEQYFIGVTKGEEREPLQITGFSFGRMQEDQYIFSRAVLEPDRFFEDASAFIGQFGLESELRDELLRYQRESILLPGAADKVLDFAYDFPAYFNKIYDGSSVPLQKQPVQLLFSVPYDVSTADNYSFMVLLRGRLSDNAFYKINTLSASASEEHK